MSDRRRFIVKTGGALVAAGAAAVADGPYVIAQPKVQWRMSTAFTPSLDVHLATSQQLAKIVEETSGGRFQIAVSPGGQIMQPFECFDAGSRGTIEDYMGASYYWTDRRYRQQGPEEEPAFEWFHTIPFGMNPEGMAAWFHQGDGLRLWEEAYAPFNLVPRPGPAIAPQMAGWFRKKITTTSDYKGLKMRISGLGRKVITKAGA